MKITDVRKIFSRNNLYLKVITDEGIYGVGECTLNTRQLGVAGVLDHLKPVLIGQNPMNIEHIWQDIFRGTFWRGGPVLQSALSAVDAALWDIKGKALNTPVYNLLGGAAREKILVYTHVRGYELEEFGEDALRKVEQGYKVLRICPHDIPGTVYEPGPLIRRSVKFMEHLRKLVGEDIEIILEVHTRLNPARAIELCNAVADLRPLFVEDPLRSDSPEAFKVLREHTNVPLATGEKFGPKWDYRYIIENDLIDYVRTDVCNCGGLTEAKKIAALAETHYQEMAPHGLPSMVGTMTALHLDMAIPNLLVQEFFFTREKDHYIRYNIEFKDGYVSIPPAPGLGVDIIEEACTETFEMVEHPHWRREDGSVQDW